MKERRKGNISRDRWMVSYADFITLLFAFFVVLFAFAKADQKKQVQISSSIDSAFRSLGLFPDASRHPSNAASASGQRCRKSRIVIVFTATAYHVSHLTQWRIGVPGG